MSHNLDGDPSLGRLRNVFRVLAEPNHQRRQEALQLRQKLSSEWQVMAVQDRWFAWPTTAAPRGTGGLNHCEWRPYGMLSLLGYHVGELQPKPRAERWCILEFVFECHLPPLANREYLLEWGKPQTTQRLSKIANALAAFTRNAKRRDPVSLGKAIDDWECDLAFCTIDSTSIFSISGGQKLVLICIRVTCHPTPFCMEIP